MVTVDFHVHSTASDGMLTPRELIEQAEGFAAIALTDHDNCDGVEAFRAAGQELKARVETICAGVELSIEPGEGFDKFHLLGLGVDPGNAELKNLLQRILDGRNARNRRIQANFQRLGIPMPLDPRHPRTASTAGTADPDVGEPPLDVIARPHYAQWLVEHGLAADNREAFVKYLQPDSPTETRCYEERWHPGQAEAFGAIHAAGGICIMAHPKYWRRRWEGDMEKICEGELERLKELGLDGLEALYQANTLEENLLFTRLADRLKLLKSAGSDFHGAAKPAIQLGMRVTEEFIAPLLERLRAAPVSRIGALSSSRS